MADKKLYSEAGLLHPTPPFDFVKSLDFLRLFAPMQSEQTISGHLLTKAMSVEGQPIAFQVETLGRVEAPQLKYQLFSAQPIAPPWQETAVERLSFFLSLKDDLRPLYAMGQEDPHFLPILQQLYGYHQVKYLTPFESACWAVLSQRTPLVVARRLKQALVEKFGGRVEVNGTIHWAFPEPAALVRVGSGELLALIRNQRKTEYLSAVAKAFHTVEERFLRTASHDEVEAWLRKIKGIGEWSVTFVLLRGLGKMKQAPLNEKRLLETVVKVYGQTQLLTRQEIERIAKRYGPWQGYWAHYLRVAT